MLDRVSRELAMTYPEMAQELSMTSIEIGFLPDRNKALSNLAERCTLPEVRGIVSVLIQTEKYGTPIAQALRVLSAEFRQSRMLRAEQKAARLPALMTVPMILFILPVLFHRHHLTRYRQIARHHREPLIYGQFIYLGS